MAIYVCMYVCNYILSLSVMVSKKFINDPKLQDATLLVQLDKRKVIVSGSSFSLSSKIVITFPEAVLPPGLDEIVLVTLRKSMFSSVCTN